MQVTKHERGRGDGIHPGFDTHITCTSQYLFVFLYLQLYTVSEVGSQHATKAAVTQRRGIYLSDVKTACRRRQPAALNVGRDTVLCRTWRIRSSASYAILSTLTFLDYTP